MPLAPQQLVPKLGDLTSDGRIDSLASDRRREPIGLRIRQPVETIEDVGRTARGSLSSGGAHVRDSAVTNEDVSFREQGRNRGTLSSPPGAAGGDHEPRQPRVNRPSEHRFAERCDLVLLFIEGFHHDQECKGSGQTLRSRPVKPLEMSGASKPPSVQREHGRREIDAVDFRQLEWVEPALFALRPEADAPAGCCPARTARSLIGRRAADPLQLPAVDAPLRVIMDRPSQSAVDDHGDPVDRHRGLSDVRAQDDLAALAGTQGAVLVLRRQRPVQGQDKGARSIGDRFQLLGQSANFSQPGQEDQDVSGASRALEQVLHNGCDDLGAGWPRSGVVFDRNRMSTAFGGDDRAATQEPRDRLGVERRRHDDHDQIGPDLAPDLVDEGQGEVGVQIALVKLVKNDGADRFQKRITQKLPGENALRKESQPRCRAEPLFEADLVANLAAESPAPLRRNPGRSSPRRDPTRLQNQHVGMVGRKETRIENGRRNSRSLARARGRNQHQRARCQRLQNPGNACVDR